MWDPRDLKPGLVLDGRYRLESRIGAGNFGTVYKARHLELDHTVAVKVLQTSAVTNPDAMARFRREGISACRVRHPNAVSVLDSGLTARGVAYLVMELLAGYPLEDEMKGGRALPVARSLRIAGAVCEALAAAHRAGIVHRDIKPGNVFLHQAGGQEVPKVLDFGIAKIAGAAALEQKVTLEGWIVGTPVYMAPERFDSEEVTGEADVYSVGVMLFQMLTGQLPFDSDRDLLAVAVKHKHDPPPAAARAAARRAGGGGGGDPRRPAQASAAAADRAGDGGAARGRASGRALLEVQPHASGEGDAASAHGHAVVRRRLQPRPGRGKSAPGSRSRHAGPPARPARRRG